MKGTEHFKRTIKEYLDGKARTDELFAVSYAKENKNLDDCITFILNQVKASGCCGMTDDEVWSLAIHYYDEDNIDVGKPISCGVVVNHKVELTEEEKAQARKDALKAYQEEEMRKIQQRHSRPKPTPKLYRIPKRNSHSSISDHESTAKFQHQVVAANGRLLPITEKQAEWAFRHTVGHYAFRTPSGQTTCLDCGHRWNEQRRSVAIARTATPN